MRVEEFANRKLSAVEPFQVRQLTTQVEYQLLTTLHGSRKGFSDFRSELLRGKLGSSESSVQSLDIDENNILLFCKDFKRALLAILDQTNSGISL